MAEVENIKRFSTAADDHVEGTKHWGPVVTISQSVVSKFACWTKFIAVCSAIHRILGVQSSLGCAYVHNSDTPQHCIIMIW